MHRKIIPASYILIGLLVLGLNVPLIFPGQILAMLGSLTVVSCVVSPVMVYYSAKDIRQLGLNKTTLNYLVLALVYFVSVTIIVYKIWPQLMGI